MLKIGLTGGIGTGKSTIAKLFSINGIPLYESDLKAKWLVENHPEIKKEIIKLIGPESYYPDGKYNRDYVSSKVFGNEEVLQNLNKIIHPRVKVDFENWVQNQNKTDFVIKEAAIMNKHAGLDKIIVVDSPLDLRISRLLKRDKHRNLNQILEIINNQKSREGYLAIADFVIENNEERLLIPQVLNIIKAIS